ncbi:hypothetical protein AXF42_Ash005513 [Apostasia shenzhenica]|uniref:Uncharacterized protein n=1 Tax=Apostasia shenzhenica TaxID=1088818 RepID=A0A2I0B741_9ASPA|nr:hypothetical protein AXF42_Ash005513 [Apostasia shenzhenica]
MFASQIAELEKHVSSQFETIERKFDALSSRVTLLEKRQSDNYEINIPFVSKFMENPTTIREESLSLIEVNKPMQRSEMKSIERRIKIKNSRKEKVITSPYTIQVRHSKRCALKNKRDDLEVKEKDENKEYDMKMSKMPLKDASDEENGDNKGPAYLKISSNKEHPIFISPNKPVTTVEISNLNYPGKQLINLEMTNYIDNAFLSLSSRSSVVLAVNNVIVKRIDLKILLHPLEVTDSILDAFAMWVEVFLRTSCHDNNDSWASWARSGVSHEAFQLWHRILSHCWSLISLPLWIIRRPDLMA